MTHLHIFALNELVEISHTNLTRQKGGTPALPPLADWLGVDTIDTDEIELFPINELADMALSDYIKLAFAPAQDIPSDTVTRLNALTGAIMLVPDSALPTPAAPGPQATLIASIPLAEADNSASLPKADVAPMPSKPAPQQHEAAPPVALYVLIFMAFVAAIIVFVGWS